MGGRQCKSFLTEINFESLSQEYVSNSSFTGKSDHLRVWLQDLWKEMANLKLPDLDR
jgi:hypothetical protein